MKLHYQTFGSGPALVILHGLFGSADNWRALAKQLASYGQVISVDLRNHGRSPHSAQQNYELMADDLAQLVDEMKLTSINLIGHSIGGKVAMAFSQHYPQLLDKLVVVDMAPRAYGDEYSHIFKALLELDLSLYTSRNEADNGLAVTLPNKAVRQFLLMNLAIENQQLSWRINLAVLYTVYPQLLGAVCVGKKINVTSCFIRGGRSNYVQDDDIALIKTTFPNSQIVTIEQAGHWVHAEAPQPFLNKIIEFFDYD